MGTHKALTNVQTQSSLVEEEHKLRLLVQTLEHYKTEGKFRVLVFVNKKETARFVHQGLSGQHLNVKGNSHVEADIEEEFKSFRSKWKDSVHVLHSDVQVDDRLKLFQTFSSMSESIIVSTDV